MATTWLTRLQANGGADIRLYFTIQGIPDVFQEDQEDVPSTLEAAARPRRKLVERKGITQSAARLDLSERKIEGGTLTITLVDDEDATLATLFAPRSYRSTFVIANESASDATINVKSTADIDTLTHVYVDAETITYTGTTSNSLTGCTRGAYESVAAAHYGSSADGVGASVYISPPSWEGRRVYLHSYFLNDDGTTSADLSRDEGVFRIESPPQQSDDGRWTIQCSELSDEIYQKRIGRGLREVQIDPIEAEPSGSAGTFDLYVGEEAIEQFATGDVDTFVVRTNEGGGFACNRIVSVNTGTDTIRFGEQLASGVPVPWGATASVRHIAILEDQWAQIALQVLTSRLGTNVNGGSDDLPGTERAGFAEPFFQFGAGIEHTDIDTAAFRAVGDNVYGRFVIDAEMSVADFLFEFCLATSSVPYTTRAGLLSVRPISLQSNTTVMTVTEAHLSGADKATVTYDEGTISPRVDLQCNYDVLTQRYAGRINTYDSELAARYPGKEKTLDLQSKSIFVEGYPMGLQRTAQGRQEIQPAPSMRKSLGQVENFLRQVQVTSGRGRGFLRGRWRFDLLQLALGDLVTLQVTAPNLEGSTEVSQLARVVELGPDWNGNAVDAAFELVDQLFVFAPACLIDSAAVATLTLTTGTLEAYEAATPGQMFADGSAVQVWDISAGTFVQRTVVSHTDTTVTLSAAPGFVIEAGVDLLRHDDQTLAIETANDDGFDGADFTYQMNDDEQALITIGGVPTRPTVSRWR